MNLLEAIVLGIVEGITEYLPVSSTGHLILASSLMGLTERVDKDSLDAFNIVIQGGAILAVLGLYRARVWQMIQGLLGRDAVGLRLAVNVTAAFMPAAILGVLLAGTIKRYLFFPLPVLSALAAGGVLMIAIDRWQERRFQKTTNPHDPRTYTDLEGLPLRGALLIGLLQCLAMWPGTSRSMVTIVGGMLAGMKPRQAAEFSFILGLPTLGAACAYSLLKNLAGDAPNMFETLGTAPMLAGLIVATVSAAVAVSWLVSFLTRHGLSPFGWYRLVLCVVMGALIWQGAVTISPEEAIPATPLASPARTE
ncbi:MAG: undecaprenyl-diphosphate phosphatase [Acidobacteria bacterium]|nr:undecaprenyl-diphosphate phosphatase [Acidobacteriota bacterium]